MLFQGTQRQLKNKSDYEKLEYNLQVHNELHDLYTLITKMVLVCMRRKIPLIIENPYSQHHYLTRYWSLKPSIIDQNRTKRGDYFNKPTQYWFINREPSNNFIFEPMVLNEHKQVHKTHDIVERSMISPEYANRFIREFII